MAKRRLSALTFACFAALTITPAATFALDYQVPYVKEANIFYYGSPAANDREVMSLSAYLPLSGTLNGTYCGRTVSMLLRASPFPGCIWPTAGCARELLSPPPPIIVQAVMPTATGNSCRTSNAQGVDDLRFENVGDQYVYMTLVLANRNGIWPRPPAAPRTLFFYLSAVGQWLTTPDAVSREIPLFDCTPPSVPAKQPKRWCNGPF